MKLKRCMLVAGALAVSPMATPAFAAKQTVAERIAAADATKAKDDGKGKAWPWGKVLSGIVIGGLIILAGIDPPTKTDDDGVRSRFLSHG
jgi:hypothetical protein